jgi:hypothetical protein
MPIAAGRLALVEAVSRRISAALANSSASCALPTSDVVPRSLVLAGESHWYAGRFGPALSSLSRVELEYASDAAAPSAYLAAGRVWLSLGDPVAAMEELQQVRNRWPDSPEAAIALARTTLLHRLYVRALRGPAYTATGEAVGPAKLSNVISLAVTGRGASVGERAAVGVVTPASAPPAGPGGRLRGLVIDQAGNLVVLEQSALRPIGAQPVLSVTEGTGAVEPLRARMRLPLSVVTGW